MKITVFRRKKRKKHLLYFGRNYTIDFLSQALSPIPINSSEKKRSQIDTEVRLLIRIDFF